MRGYQIEEPCSCQDGNIQENDPFCGVIFSLLSQGTGDSFLIATVSPGRGDLFGEEEGELSFYLG
ncbi:MAG: hypothetical protein A2157_10865 [Deltaproteobacteria bacterium RBG_16_47_11]|nr:MAG: hypothetical protein A2157_10865 [Deltaproteobacteria bacterium RBG_16_47_11]